MKQTIENNMIRAIKLLKDSEICAELDERLLSLVDRIQRNELIISVIGQFKRGKSTFINSVLQKDILPTGIIPVTSCVTKLHYGDEKALVTFGDGAEKTVSIGELHQYISESENPQNQKNVSFVDIYCRNAILKEGLILVDTPGVGSVHKHNTDSAYSFVKDSDAVLFMLSVDSPLNEIELDFLKTSNLYAAKFYFAVNKIDTVSQPELDTYTAYCKNILCGVMNTDTIDIFPVSAKNGFGIDALLLKIGSDLEHSKEALLNQSARDKSLDIMHEALSKLQLYQKALCMPLEQLEQKKEQLNKKLLDIDLLSKRAVSSVEQDAKEKLAEISKAIKQKSDATNASLSASIENLYRSNMSQGTKKLEQILIGFYESELHAQLEQINASALDALKKGYEETAEKINGQMTEIKKAVSDIVFQLFNIEYRFENSAYILSEREDFYIRLNRAPGVFFITKNDLIYLLPKKYANKLIYQRILNKMKEDNVNNTNNMIYNYRYKMRESLRMFQSNFFAETGALKNDVEELIDRVMKSKKI